MKTLPALTIAVYAVILTLFTACDNEDQTLLQASFDADVTTVPAGDSIVFRDRSSGGTATWNWAFEGGTPASSVLSEPTITYHEPGTYSVTLEISNNGDSDKIQEQEFITVTYGGLVPGFNADKTTILASQQIRFTNTSRGIVEDSKWEFVNENGTVVSSTEKNPEITFNEMGIYTAKLTVSNPETSETVTKENYINVLDPDTIEADFTSDDKGTYSGGSITFENTSTGISTSQSWTFEGGHPSVSTEDSPAVTYSTPGKYKVSLVVSNDKNTSTVEKEGYITVIPGEQLAAFYPYDGNSNDAGPHNLPVQNTGEVSFDATGRHSGNAAVFSGSNLLIIPDQQQLNFGKSDFSVALWIKTGDNSKMMIWQESGANGSRDNQTWLRIGDNLTDRIFRFAVEDSGGGSIQNAGTPEVPGGIADNQWHHVVCVREGLTSSIYVDGTLIKRGNAPTVKEVSNDQDFKIGAQEGGIGEYKTFFKGLLDDLIIYNKALTDDEIRFLYEL